MPRKNSYDYILFAWIWYSSQAVVLCDDYLSMQGRNHGFWDKTVSCIFEDVFHFQGRLVSLLSFCFKGYGLILSELAVAQI